MNIHIDMKILEIAKHIWLGNKKSFMFNGICYLYFDNEYNSTIMNERAVEIPIIFEFIKKFRGKNILEIGNVLSHYYSVNHEVIDKYEKNEGVKNIDIVEFDSEERYDLIVSISTLEHVGWDEEKKDSQKIIYAIQKLRDYLKPYGRLVVTLPLGYNTNMDHLFSENKIQFDDQYYLKRVSENNLWKQVNWSDIKDSKYNTPFPYANGLIIGIMRGEIINKKNEIM